MPLVALMMARGSPAGVNQGGRVSIEETLPAINVGPLAQTSAPSVANFPRRPIRGIDRGIGSISAAECATPEVRSPLEGCQYVLAGHLLEVGRGASTCFEAEMRRRLPALTEELIAAARSIPPQDTRAKVRGAFVSKFAGTAGGAGWDALSHPDGRRIELPDPFDFDVEV